MQELKYIYTARHKIIILYNINSTMERQQAKLKNKFGFLRWSKIITFFQIHYKMETKIMVGTTAYLNVIHIDTRGLLKYLK